MSFFFCSQIKLKLDKSEKELAKLNSKWRPSEQAPDREFLTEEERQSLRKIGLKMDESLLLGMYYKTRFVIWELHDCVMIFLKKESYPFLF